VDGVGAPTGTTDAPAANGASSGAAAGAAAPIASTTTVPVTGAGAVPAQQESLNLVTLVGPALLKRLVPVVVGAVGLALLSRLLWRRRRGLQQAERA
jgi:hypothetical protein